MSDWSIPVLELQMVVIWLMWCCKPTSSPENHQASLWPSLWIFCSFHCTGYGNYIYLSSFESLRLCEGENSFSSLTLSWLSIINIRMFSFEILFIFYLWLLIPHSVPFLFFMLLFLMHFYVLYPEYFLIVIYCVDFLFIYFWTFFLVYFSF